MPYKIILKLMTVTVFCQPFIPDRVVLGFHCCNEFKSVKVRSGRQRTPEFFHFKFSEIFLSQTPMMEIHRHVLSREDFVDFVT